MVEDCARSVHSGRVADAQVFFFCGSVDKTISRGFCMRRCFIFIRTYIRFNVFFARKHSSHALRTDNSSSAKSVLQPAGYNARRRALWRSLLLLSDLGSAIEDRAGICELLSALCVIHATGADNQRCCAAAAAAAVLCFGQRWQQQSSSAIVAGSREGNSAYPPSAVIICHAYCCCLY